MELSLFYEDGKIEMLDNGRKVLTYTVPEVEREQLRKTLDDKVRGGGDIWEKLLNTYLILYNYLEGKEAVPEDYKLPNDSSTIGEPASLGCFDLPLLGP